MNVHLWRVYLGVLDDGLSEYRGHSREYLQIKANQCKVRQVT